MKVYCSLFTDVSKLPPSAWMIGAGIVPGFSSLPFISRSVELGEPVIFVSLNYRLSGLLVKSPDDASVNITDPLFFRTQWLPGRT